ncbi:hypothetical protein JQK15_13545 [Sphingobium sp. BHU LFT2]|uniref:hypothetical protein n=1 Tax=Sphingobium sp. BHU LFT2 TaxID=2807634 RepID=UPI001BE74C6E|nr:hypothetical protein [Sphingobium sp. BHU LFT2]MBT2244563.1 hypothetical protein [Sphingobium sp. BHU LFT2]
MIKDQDYIRRLEAKIVELTMSNDDLWQELEDAKEAAREAKSNSWSPADWTIRTAAELHFKTSDIEKLRSLSITAEEYRAFERDCLTNIPRSFLCGHPIDRELMRRVMEL